MDIVTDAKESVNHIRKLEFNLNRITQKAATEEKQRSTRNILLFLAILFLIAGVVILSYYNIDNYNKIENKDEDTQMGYSLSIGFISTIGVIILLLCVHFIRNRGYLHIHRDVFFRKRRVNPSTFYNPAYSQQQPTSQEISVDNSQNPNLERGYVPSSRNPSPLNFEVPSAYKNIDQYYGEGEV